MEQVEKVGAPEGEQEGSCNVSQAVRNSAEAEPKELVWKLVEDSETLGSCYGFSSSV